MPHCSAYGCTCILGLRNQKHQEELSDISEGISEDDEELYDSQVELFSGSEEKIWATNTSKGMHLGQEAAMEVTISQ